MADHRPRLVAIAVALLRALLWPLWLVEGRFCPNDPRAPADAPELLLEHHRTLVDKCNFRAENRTFDLRMTSAWDGPELHAFESVVWPRPRSCPPQPRDSAGRTCSLGGPHYLRALNEHTNESVLIHVVWKAGSGALTRFWRCVFGPSRAPHDLPLHHHWLTAGQAREPVSRFLSAYAEVIKDMTGVVLLEQPPAGGRGSRAGEGAAAGDGGADAEAQPAQRVVRLPNWRTLVKIKLGQADSGGAPLDDGQLRRLLAKSDAGWLLAGYAGTLGLQPPRNGARDKARRRPDTEPVRLEHGVLDERARFRAFAHATECVARYDTASRHLHTASLFHGIRAVSRAYAPAPRPSTQPRPLPGECAPQAPLDSLPVQLLLRTESLAEDTDALLRRMNATELARANGCAWLRANPSLMGSSRRRRARRRGLSVKPPARAQPIVVGKLKSFVREAAASAEPIVVGKSFVRGAGFPSRAALQAQLQEEPELMRTVCRIYFQDFVCGGYPLPKACRGGAVCAAAASVGL